MKHTKYLSLLLTLFLTFQMFPGNALAADNNVIASDNAIVSPVISDAELDNPSSVRGLTAQQALSGPSDIDFDGEALLLYELNSGTLAYAKNIDEQREPASLTKIMTCLLALERGTLTDTITVTESALEDMDPDGSAAGLLAGETYTLEELLYCLMVKSANDAASVIAEYLAGSESAFVEMMNSKALDLGCENTHFENPHGLHADGHYTTARDMAAIMLAALAYPKFEEIYSTSSYEAPATELQDTRTFITTNYMISDAVTTEYLDDRVIGGKTGFTTPAGRCIVCVAEQGGLRYLAVVLGASSIDDNGEAVYSNFTTATALLDYGFDSFALEEVLSTAEEFDSIDVNYGNGPVYPAAAASVVALLPTDYDDQQLRTEVSTSVEGFIAPIAAGDSLGTADIYYGSLCIGSVSLVASNDVALEEQFTASSENPSETAPSAAPEETSGHRTFRISVTVVAAIIGIAALLLLLLIIRASILRSMRRKRRNRRSQLPRNPQSRRQPPQNPPRRRR